MARVGKVVALSVAFVLGIGSQIGLSAASAAPFPSAPEGTTFAGQWIYVGRAEGSAEYAYWAPQDTSALTHFATTAAPSYEAIGYRVADGYIYGIHYDNPSKAYSLVRIGITGTGTGVTITSLGTLAGLDPSTWGGAMIDAGTFGQGATADIMYVRTGTTSTSSNTTELYMLDFSGCPVTATDTTPCQPVVSMVNLSTAMPLVGDMFYLDGFLWGVDQTVCNGSNTTCIPDIWRMDVKNTAGGIVPTVKYSLQTYVDAKDYSQHGYGSAWVYANGDFGFSTNVNKGHVYRFTITEQNGDPYTGVGAPKFAMVPGFPIDSLITDNFSDGTSSGVAIDLSLTKTADKTVVKAGQTITYTLTVTNNSRWDSSGWTVTDTIPANFTLVTKSAPADVTCPVTGTTMTCTGGLLAAGASAVITYTGTAKDVTPVTQITNTATVKGREPDTDLTNNTDEATVDVAAIQITKTATPDQGVRVGDTVTYTFDVLNTGTAPLTDVVIDDTVAFTGTNGPLVIAACTNDGTALPDPAVVATQPSGITLGVGKHLICTADYTLSAADVAAGKVDNTAATAGMYENDAMVTDEDSATVHVASINLVKVVYTVNGADTTDWPVPSATTGDAIVYRLTATNDGPLALTGVWIDDSVFAGQGAALTIASCTLNPGTDNTPVDPAVFFADTSTVTLEPADQVVCLTDPYTVVADDLALGTLTNSATVTGHTTSDIVTSTDDAAVNMAAIALTKTPSQTAVKVGDTITYTLVATNTGQAPLWEVDIQDRLVGYFLGTPQPAFTVAACTITDDTGAVVAASPCRLLSEGHIISPSALALQHNWSMTVTTTAYTVVDADLAVGDLVNTGSVVAIYANYNNAAASVSDRKTVTVPVAAITLTKDVATINGVAAGASPSAKAGDTVVYTFTATNTGKAHLDNVMVAETAFSGAPTPVFDATKCAINGVAVVCSAVGYSLDAGDVLTLQSAPYTVTETDVATAALTNTATVTGTYLPERTVTATDGASVTMVATPVPLTTGIALTKTANPTTVTTAGDVVTYVFGVTNTGEVALNSVKVTERTFSGTGTAPVVTGCTIGNVAVLSPNSFTLAAGAVATCTATYTVTQDDIDAGTPILNTAYATGVPADETPQVTSPDANATVTVAGTTGITLVKTADPTTVTKAGQTVTYTFTVTNTGTVTLDDVAIAETAFSGSGQLSARACTVGGTAVTEPFTLAAKGVATCTATYTVTQTDVDAGKDLTNAAVASGTPKDGKPKVDSPSDVPVKVTRTPDVTVLKEVDKKTAKVGDQLTYTFTIRNTGNVSQAYLYADDLSGSDAQAWGETMTAVCVGQGFTPPEVTMTIDGTTYTGMQVAAPGQVIVCTLSPYTVTEADGKTGTVTNTVMIGAFAVNGPEQKDSDPSTVTTTITPKKEILTGGTSYPAPGALVPVAVVMILVGGTLVIRRTQTH